MYYCMRKSCLGRYRAERSGLNPQREQVYKLNTQYFRQGTASLI